MWSKWRTWLVVAIVLLSAHGATAWYYAARYERGRVFAGTTVLKLDMTPDEWAHAMGGTDAGAYLRTAENFAAGKGVTITVTDDGRAHDVPFYYWGPGAPVVFGSWLKLVGGQTMWAFFWFAVIAQVLFGVLALATASIWTRSPWALATVALCTGICLPMQQWFYGDCLTSSEIVALVPLSAILFALAKGFAAYHKTSGTFWANVIEWRVVLWFALAGILIGLNSLIRDSTEVLATFIPILLIGRACLFDRRRLALAACAAAVLVASMNCVRLPVKQWNKHRVGERVVSTGANWGVWYISLWSRHDKFAWFATCGVGIGEYLDPAAAKRVEAYFLDHKPHPEWYSFGQFVQAVCKRPLDAIAFKAVRLPVLWLGATELLPTLQLGLLQSWCIAFYVSFVAFCVIQFRNRRRIPEVLYIYLLMMISASAMIHYEFRYTFPVWNTLVMVPGLMIGIFVRSNRLRLSVDQQPDNAVQAPRVQLKALQTAA